MSVSAQVQAPDHGTGATWAARLEALAAEPAFRALVADSDPAVAAPLLSRRERRIAQRAARRAARRAAHRAAHRAARRLTPGVVRRTTRPGSVRLPANVTAAFGRGTAVALAAGLLVSGGMGAPGAAGLASGYGGVAGVIAPFSAARATSAHAARLDAQTDAAARVSRAESLAVADAALAAAVAVRPLASQLEADDVPAELGVAVERLVLLVRSAQPLAPARMSAEVPLPPARPTNLTAPTGTASSTVPADGTVPDDGAPADGTVPEDDGVPADDGAPPQGTAPVEELAPARAAAAAAEVVLVPLERLADAGRGGAGDDRTGTPGADEDSDDAADDTDLAGSAVAEDPVDDASTAADGTADDGSGTADDGSGTADDGSGTADDDAGLPVDDAALAAEGDGVPDPADDAAAPVTDAAPVPGELGATGLGSAGPEADPGALTQALADVAGEVFRLSMQVEALSGGTELDETVARVTALQSLETVATTADETTAALAELEPPTRLTPEERAALARRDADARAVESRDGVEPVRSRARVRADVPAGVSAFLARWDNGRIPAEALCAVDFAPHHRLQCDAAAALSGLNADYRAEFGTNLALVSSYRPFDVQVSLRASKGALAAVPGRSNHGWGLAVDLGGIGGLGEFDRPGYLWLKEHAGVHGWHHPRAMEPGGSGPPEPWHWEFGTD